MLSKERGESAVHDIVTGNKSRFRLVMFHEFKKYHQGSSFKSKHYERFYVLCHLNSSCHSGWMVCLYVLIGFCLKSKEMFSIQTKLGGTNRLGRHITGHETSSQTEGPIEVALPSRSRDVVSNAAAVVVVHDLRPLSFAENGRGMTAFAQAILEAGQNIPSGVSVNPKSYTPSRTSITLSLDRMVK